MILPEQEQKETSLESREDSYRKKYEAIVHFLYHEYTASLSTFEGLLLIMEEKNDPLLEYFQQEFIKYKNRAREVGKRHADLN
jgi:hypothetical protein